MIMRSNGLNANLVYVCLHLANDQNSNIRGMIQTISAREFTVEIQCQDELWITFHFGNHI